nr:DNA replication/repair protein RecF [Paracoccus sp. S-4012]
MQLAQFRSWTRLDLGFDGRPVAIHGPNGSGKTNILEAISMLSPGRGLRGAAPGEQGRQQAGVGWRVRAVLGGHEVETGAQDGPREVLVDGKPAPQVALGRLARVIWLVPAMDRLWTDAPEVRRRFLDRLTLSFLPEHAEAALTWDKAMRERNRLLRDEVSDPRWYGALEAQMAEAGAAVTRNRLAALDRLAAAQADGQTPFPAARLALLPGEGFADDPDPVALATRLAHGRNRDLAAGRTLTGPHRADLGAVWGPQDMPAALASTGEQKALLLSLILANARALAGETVLLLLDEVAAHLDAGRRAMLYDEIAALRAQSLLTGTGRELFEALEGRAMFLQVSHDGRTSRAEVEA